MDAFAAYAAWTVATLLLSVRLGGALLMTPLLAIAEVPLSIRILIVLGLSAALASSMQIEPTLMKRVGEPGALFQILATELGLGLVLAVSIHLAFAAFALAGRLLDLQIGFALSQIFDPVSNTQTTILTTLFTRAGVLLFFLVNGHHALMRGIVFSVERIPLGSSWVIDGAVGPAIQSAGEVFSLAIALAAPAVLAIVITELALAVIARNLPQINMLVMGVPIKIVVGLLVLASWFGTIGGVADRVYKSIYDHWNTFLTSSVDGRGVDGRATFQGAA